MEKSEIPPQKNTFSSNLPPFAKSTRSAVGVVLRKEELRGPSQAILGDFVKHLQATLVHVFLKNVALPTIIRNHMFSLYQPVKR